MNLHGKVLTVCVTTLLVTMTGPTITLGQSFQGLGDLPGGDFASIVSDISADGSTVVGYSGAASGYLEAFRWTAATGMLPIGDAAGGYLTHRSNGVSANGSVVVGVAYNNDLGRERGFVWTQDTGPTTLSILTPSRPDAYATMYPAMEALL